MLLALGPIRKQREKSAGAHGLRPSRSICPRPWNTAVHSAEPSLQVSSLWKCLHIHTEGRVSTVVLNLVRLIVKDDLYSAVIIIVH